MRSRLLCLLSVLVLATTIGCRSLRVDARFVLPAQATATAEAEAANPALTPPAFPPADTPLPASGPTAVPAPATVVPTPLPAPVAPGPATSGESALDAPVQALLSYFDAVNERDYPRAYRLWGGGGAASNQTPEQFAAGYANTVQVSLQVGQASTAGSSVAVPVTITSVVNVPGSDGSIQDQRMQHYIATYTLQRAAASGADAWTIAGATVEELPESTPVPADLGDPLAVLQSYFDAINRHEYARAFTYWNYLGRASKQTFAQFHQGFLATGHVAIELGKPERQGAAGSSYAGVPVVVIAMQTDQTVRTFCGTYTLRSLNPRPFDQFGWRIEAANLVPTANVEPGSAEAQRLLQGGCAG